MSLVTRFVLAIIVIFVIGLIADDPDAAERTGEGYDTAKGYAVLTAPVD